MNYTDVKEEHEMSKKKTLGDTSKTLGDMAREMRDSLTDKEREILDARFPRAKPFVMTPKTGEKWKHPTLGIGVVNITPGGYIEVNFESGAYAAFRAAKDFHEDGFVRVTEKGSDDGNE